MSLLLGGSKPSQSYARHLGPIIHIWNWKFWNSRKSYGILWNPIIAQAKAHQFIKSAGLLVKERITPPALKKHLLGNAEDTSDVSFHEEFIGLNLTTRDRRLNLLKHPVSLAGENPVWLKMMPFRKKWSVWISDLKKKKNMWKIIMFPMFINCHNLGVPNFQTHPKSYICIYIYIWEYNYVDVLIHVHTYIIIILN